MAAFIRVCPASAMCLGLLALACGRADSDEGAAAPLTARAVTIPAPVAAVRPHTVEAPHGAARQDEYYWLRDDLRQDPDVLAHLRTENAYADAVMASLGPLRETLYAEMVGRIKQDDTSVPYRYRDYWYYTRFEEGKEYPIHARRKGSMDAAEEVLLDLNELAKGQSFYQIASWALSPNQQQIAWLEDSVGRRQYTLRIRNLAAGETYADQVSGLSSSLAWAGDDRTIYYVMNDPVTLLSKRVKTHVVGTAVEADRVVYEESDDSFYIDVGLTRSEQYLCINVRSTLSSETRCTDRKQPGRFRLVAARERDVEYTADHLGTRWVIRTNWHAKNFKLMEVPDGVWNDRSTWTDLIPHAGDVFIGRFELFDTFLAVSERSGGLSRLRIVPQSGAHTYVAADESAYAMSLATNAEPSTDRLRYVYTSLTTPASTYELDVRTGGRTLLKEQPVLGGFDKSHYVTTRLWAPARDGTRIPVSVLHRREFRKDGTAALLQYGYGSYGAVSDPTFNSDVLSLVDRGMVYAIAHIRGGQEMGRAWYEDGKLLRKMNTFTDFIDVTDFLVAERYAAPDRVAAAGGSAGGLLVGAVANLAPEKYRVILSRVPFVDVVTTMLDESIPLTTNEFDEWGNPKERDYYEYMLSYSPYDQLSARAYPAMFVTTGLWDSQVQYWEPAKYVARLRARRTDDNLLVFRTQMEAGHGGKSGRFQRFHEQAELYAFLLNQLGVPGDAPLRSAND
jgi:oligopeptidase B